MSGMASLATASRNLLSRQLQTPILPQRAFLSTSAAQLKLVFPDLALHTPVETEPETPINPFDRTVAVGVSGGVDSAVALGLLLSKGYNVVPVHMTNWDQSEENDECTAERDLFDARKIARHYDLDLVELNYVKEYWNNVFEEFLNSYRKGYTPNPDLNCNRFIKFGAFYQHAVDKLDADFVATGHYARLLYPLLPSLLNETSDLITDEEKALYDAAYTFAPHNSLYPPTTPRLVTSVDPYKDQTYFLSQVDPASLSKVIFPLGHLRKTQVRALAEYYKVPVAEKRDSTGICFVGKKKRFQHFLESYIPSEDIKPAPLVSLDMMLRVLQPQAVNYLQRRRQRMRQAKDGLGLPMAFPTSLNRLYAGFVDPQATIHLSHVRMEEEGVDNYINKREWVSEVDDEHAKLDELGSTVQREFIQWTGNLFSDVPAHVHVNPSVNYSFDIASNRFYTDPMGVYRFDPNSRTFAFSSKAVEANAALQSNIDENLKMLKMQKREASRLRFSMMARARAEKESKADTSRGDRVTAGDRETAGKMKSDKSTLEPRKKTVSPSTNTESIMSAEQAALEEMELSDSDSDGSSSVGPTDSDTSGRFFKRLLGPKLDTNKSQTNIPAQLPETMKTIMKKHNMTYCPVTKLIGTSQALWAWKYPQKARERGIVAVRRGKEVYEFNFYGINTLGEFKRAAWKLENETRNGFSERMLYEQQKKFVQTVERAVAHLPSFRRMFTPQMMHRWLKYQIQCAREERRVRLLRMGGMKWDTTVSRFGERVKRGMRVLVGPRGYKLVKKKVGVLNPAKLYKPEENSWQSSADTAAPGVLRKRARTAQKTPVVVRNPLTGRLVPVGTTLAQKLRWVHRQVRCAYKDQLRHTGETAAEQLKFVNTTLKRMYDTLQATRALLRDVNPNKKNHTFPEIAPPSENLSESERANYLRIQRAARRVAEMAVENGCVSALQYTHKSLLSLTENQHVVLDPRTGVRSRLLRKLGSHNIGVTSDDDGLGFSTRYSVLVRGMNWVTPEQPLFSNIPIFHLNNTYCSSRIEDMATYVAADKARFAKEWEAFVVARKEHARVDRTYRNLLRKGHSAEAARDIAGKAPKVPPRPFPPASHDVLYMLLNALFPTCDRRVPSVREGAFECYAKLLSTGQLLPCRVYAEWVPKKFTEPYRSSSESSAASVAESVMAGEHDSELELCYRVQITDGAQFVSPGQALTLYRPAKLPYDQTCSTWEFNEFEVQEHEKKDGNERSNVVRGTDVRVGEDIMFECLGSGTVIF